MSSSTIGSHSKRILNAINQNNKDGKITNKYYKQKMVEFMHDDDKKIDMEKYEFICNFKRGGISHCNKAGLHTNGITSVDITSQYPASLIYSYIPVGKSKWVTEYDEKSIGFYYLKNLRFEEDCYDLKPVASVKESGVLNWNTGNHIDEVYIDTYTITYLKKYYGLIDFEVISGLVSYEEILGEKLFGKYVNTFFNEKKRQDILKDMNDNDYNPALRETIKLYMNSLTGKLVEDPERHYSLKFVESGIEKTLNGVGVCKEFNTDKFNEWIIAGVMVYSYSKRLLFEYIRCLPENSNSVIHIETDGIYYDTRDKEKFEENLKNYNGEYKAIEFGDELGNVKIEVNTQAGNEDYFLGKKFYLISNAEFDKKENKLVDKIKIKGIPKTYINDAGDKIKLVDRDLFEKVYSGEKVEKKFNTLKRDLFSSNTKIMMYEAKRTINPIKGYKKWE